MTEPLVTEMAFDAQEARRRKLDELFADQPYLSVTMKASRLHERAEPIPSLPMPVPVPIAVAIPDEDEILRRLTEGRTERLTDAPEADQPRPPARKAAPKSQIEAAEAADPSGLMHLDVLLDMSVSPPQVRTSLKPLPNAPDIMTLKEAATYLRVSESAIRAWVRQGRLSCARLGRRMRFRRESLLAWIEQAEGR